jgi:hypothetical protein
LALSAGFSSNGNGTSEPRIVNGFTDGGVGTLITADE